MRVWIVVALLALLNTTVAADVLIVEKMVAKAGDRTFESVRSTFIKDTRMRIEVAQNGKTAVTIYDLPAGESLELEAAKRRANVRAVAARNAKLEKEYPRARTTTTLTAAGTRQNLAGIACDDHTFTVRVPVTKDGEIALMLTGTACLSAAAPGASDYMTFAKAAYDQNLVLGQASDNYLLLAVTRGQTELYRAMTMTGGVPLAVDLTIAVDGNGMLAGIVRRAVASSRVTTATKLETADTADTLYVVPAGWKREQKK